MFKGRPTFLTNLSIITVAKYTYTDIFLRSTWIIDYTIKGTTLEILILFSS